MKFLVIWSFQPGIRPTPELVKVIFDLADYAKRMKEAGKVLSHYHIVGRHGGVWIFDAESNDELERLIAQMPVYNFANYEIYPLTEMRVKP